MVTKDDQALLIQLFGALDTEAGDKGATRHSNGRLKAGPHEVKLSSATTEDELFRLLFGVAPPKIKLKKEVKPKQETQANGVAHIDKDAGAAAELGAADGSNAGVKTEAGTAELADLLSRVHSAAVEASEEEDNDFEITLDEQDIMTAAARTGAGSMTAAAAAADVHGTSEPVAVTVSHPSSAPADRPARPHPAKPRPAAGAIGLGGAGSGAIPTSVSIPGVGSAKGALPAIPGIGLWSAKVGTSTLGKPGADGKPGLPGPPGLAGATAGPRGPLGPAPPYSRSQYINVATGLPTFVGADAHAVFPSQDDGVAPIKLPRQTRVTPEEYKEFLALGHGEIFTVDLDRVIEAPWRLPTANIQDFFNYGMNERTWREYCNKVQVYRAEFALKNKIEAVGSDAPLGTLPAQGVKPELDSDLPPEVAAVISRAAAASAAAASSQAIPVFLEADDEGVSQQHVQQQQQQAAFGVARGESQAVTRARTSEWRRHKVRLDPEAIIMLVRHDPEQEGDTAFGAAFPNIEYDTPAELQERDKERYVTLADVQHVHELASRPQAPLPRPPPVQHWILPPPQPPPGVTAANMPAVGVPPPRPPPGSPPKGAAPAGPVVGMPPVAPMPAMMMGMQQMPPLMPGMIMPNIQPHGMMMPPLQQQPQLSLQQQGSMQSSVLSAQQSGGLSSRLPSGLLQPQRASFMLEQASTEDHEEHATYEQLQPVQVSGFMDDMGQEGGDMGAEPGYEGEGLIEDIDAAGQRGDGGLEEGAFYGEEGDEGGGWGGQQDVNQGGVLDLLSAGYGGQGDEYQDNLFGEQDGYGQDKSGRREPRSSSGGGGHRSGRSRSPAHRHQGTRDRDRGHARRSRSRSPHRRSRSPRRDRDRDRDGRRGRGSRSRSRSPKDSSRRKDKRR